MINLLPPDTKQDYLYAARNTKLRRWVGVMLAAIVGLGLIATYGMVTLQHSTHSYENQVSMAQDNLKKQKLTETEAQVTDISNSFKLVVQVVSKEVLFSKLLKQIATVIPSSAILTNLNITQASNGVDIAAAASDYNTATQVQVNLADPANQIFSKADIISITCAQSPTNPKYPCTVQIRALFGSKNPFLFISNGSQK